MPGLIETQQSLARAQRCGETRGETRARRDETKEKEEEAYLPAGGEGGKNSPAQVGVLVGVGACARWASGGGERGAR